MIHFIVLATGLAATVSWFKYLAQRELIKHPVALDFSKEG